MRSKSLIVGFVASLAAFVAANIYSYNHMGFSGSGACDDCSFSFGFPFAMWLEGGFVGGGNILWGGLIADTSIALGVSIGLGWAVEQLTGKSGRLP